MQERRIYSYGGFDPVMRVNSLQITPISELLAQSAALRALPRAQGQAETVLPGLDGGLRAAPGGLGFTQSPLERVNTRLRQPIRVYGGGPQPQSAPWNRRSSSLADVLAGRAGSVTVTDPALFEGSVAEQTARPGAVQRALTAVDLLANPGQAIAGVTPQQAQEVYSELIDPPNEKGWRLTQPRQPGADPDYALYSDGTRQFADPTDWTSQLPSNVPTYLRGKGAEADAERRALLTDSGGFSSEDPSRTQTTARTGRRPVGGDGSYPERAQEVVVYRPDGTFEVRTVDPTLEVRNIEIPIDQRLSAYNSDAQDYQTLGQGVREASEDAKTRLMPRSAVEQAQRQGRLSLLPLDQREGSLIGTLSQTGQEPAPLYAPVVGGEDAGGYWRLQMARDIAHRFGDPEFENKKEDAYRIGMPLNRDIDGALRPQLAELFAAAGLPVRQGLVPSRKSADVAGIGTLQELIRGGMQVRQPGGEPLSLDQVRALAESIRWQPWSPDAPRLYVQAPAGVDATSGTPLQGPARLEGVLLPQVQQYPDRPGPMTGSFVRGVEGETGPAPLLGDPGIRHEAEKFMRRRGLSGYEAGIEGLASALARQSGRPPQTGMNAPAAASPLIQQAAREVARGLGGTAALPQGISYRLMGDGASTVATRMAPGAISSALPRAGSYGAQLLAQDVYGYMQGAVPLEQVAAALPLPGDPRQMVLTEDGRPVTGRFPYAPSYLDVVSAEMAASAPRPRATNSSPQRALVENIYASLMAGGRYDQADAMSAARAAVIAQGGPSIDASPGQLALNLRSVTPSGPSAEQGGLSQALQQAAAAQVMGGDPRQMVLTADGRPVTGQFPYAPSYLDAVSEYMAANAPGPRIMDRSPQGAQLALDLASVTQQGRQMELPIALPQGVEESWANRAGRGLEQLYARDAFGYDIRPSRQPVVAEQLNVPFRDITGEVRAIEPQLVGGGVGPYADAPYYRTPVNRAAYQGRLVQGPQQAGAPVFDYGAMAAALGNEGGPGPVTGRTRYSRRLPDGQGETIDRPVSTPVQPVEPGSPEHDRAMSQMAMRIRARLGGLR